MAKIKVLYIHQDGLITGSAISLKYFLEAMNREVYEPVVLLADEGPARELFEDLDIKVHVFKFVTFWTSPGPNWYSPRNFKQYRAFIPNKRLRRFVKDINPQIIHINDKAAINAGISLKKLKIPIVQHLRSTYNIVSTLFNKWFSIIFIQSYTDKLIAISEDESINFNEKYKSIVINNTVDFKEIDRALNKKNNIRLNEAGFSEEEIVVGFVGVVSAFKGIWYFLDVAKGIIDKDHTQKIKFLVVGKIPDSKRTLLNNNNYVEVSAKEYIETFLTENNLKEKIIFHGFAKDILKLYSSIDILFAINKFGAMGRQPIEAQALGVPVVVAEGRSKKSKVVVNGEGGIVIKSPVNMDELVNAVETLINDPELRKTMGEKGKKYAAEKFDPTKNMRKIEAIYQELLSAKKA